MSPYAAKRLWSGKELGAGIYITPNRRVAASYSGIYGKIIPVKLEENAKIAYINKETYDKLCSLIYEIFKENINPMNFPTSINYAIIECITKKLFQSHDYDGAYMEKGYVFGENLCDEDINKFIGVDQSQIAIFSPEKIEIITNNLKNRISDINLKFQAEKSKIKYEAEKIKEAYRI